MEQSIADVAAFLTARVVTRHLETFCSIARELCAQPSTRQLDDFVRNAPFVIAILPLARETTTTSTREIIRLLQRQRAQHPTTRDALAAKWKTVLRALCDKVITRNMEWLEAIVVDFLSGVDNVLDEFVRCHQAISVVPAPHDLQHESDETGYARESEVDAHPEDEDDIVDLTRTPHEPDEEPSPPSEDDEMAPRCNPRRGEPTTLASRIIERVRDIEAARPWQDVFGSGLVCPFPEAKAPVLAKKWRKFWRKYGRAVWERRFWAPFKTGTEAYRARSNRQRSAHAAFDLIIVGVFREFGPYFFVELDRRPHRHRGWWYRSKAVDLNKICHVLGEEACWKYLDSQCRRRFPRVDLQIDADGAAVKTPRPDAIWARSKVVSDIAAKVEAIKLAMQDPIPVHNQHKHPSPPLPATSTASLHVIDLSVDDDD